ncbi:MAG: thiamine diphosphokinase [Ilumatobacteraceae bacterium]
MAEQPRRVQVVVVIGGGPLSARAVQAVHEHAFVIAADSGLDHAVAAGLRPSVLVGDLDSISAAGRMWAYAHEAEIEEYPADKDLTDTELALARALTVPGVWQVLLLGGIDDTGERRLDHQLATLLALGNPALAAAHHVRAVLGTTEFAMVHPDHHLILEVEDGQLFSLLALHGPCTGVTVTGARWPLTDAVLAGTEARGVSNEAGDRTDVSVATGVLTVVVP